MQTLNEQRTKAPSSSWSTVPDSQRVVSFRIGRWLRHQGIKE